MGKNKKKKEGVSLILIVFILIVITAIGIIITINCTKKDRKAGYIENGEVVYSDLIINKSYNEESKVKILELKTEYSELNNLIITNKMIEKIKKNSDEYSRTLKDVLEDKKTSNRDVYNIEKAIELNCVKEDTKMADYYWKITGFKNLNKLIEFCEEAFELMETNV